MIRLVLKICSLSFSRGLHLQLGSDEGDFTDKLIEEDFPEDWGDDKHEFFDENGWNLLHYSVLKGFGNAVTVLVEDYEFGKFFIFSMCLHVALKCCTRTNFCGLYFSRMSQTQHFCDNMFLRITDYLSIRFVDFVSLSYFKDIQSGSLVCCIKIAPGYMS